MNRALTQHEIDGIRSRQERRKASGPVSSSGEAENDLAALLQHVQVHTGQHDTGYRFKHYALSYIRTRDKALHDAACSHGFQRALEDAKSRGVVPDLMLESQQMLLHDVMQQRAEVFKLQRQMSDLTKQIAWCEQQIQDVAEHLEAALQDQQITAGFRAWFRSWLDRVRTRLAISSDAARHDAAGDVPTHLDQPV